MLVAVGKINGESITNYIQKWYVRKKKLDSVIDKAFYENRKEFWAFVGRGNRKGIVS